MTQFKIGFIGLGVMGESMCENIIKRTSQTVFVYDILPQQVNKLVQLGATACQNIPQLADQTNLIFIMVPNNEHVNSVIDTLLPSLKKGTIVCNMSSISPAVQQDCAKKIEAAGSISLEAPVVKSKGAAISGTLGILAAGNGEALKKIEPILLHMGEQVIDYGEHGKAMAMKILHNMLVGNIQNGVNEMFTMAEAIGIDFDLAIKGCKAGGGQNFYLDGKGPSIIKQDYSPKFSVKNMAKDTKLHGMLAKDLGLSLPGSDRVRQVYDEALKSFPTQDFSATYKIVAKLSKL
ncbi:3-sulfolactaldehyde reductase [Candidatus Lokiarchaeum ossiferum]|uniref:3-sulfolactaldehyde reductase n=1 Tax=Candidatus Lokiarchaeum ossiferum TaxID=2951803 RepID=A0ABY6HPC8_9ARCH|nr:3-sulfolactaldehyde reductase [Candidatus Lokiarchaeum sp. B-35]